MVLVCTVFHFVWSDAVMHQINIALLFICIAYIRYFFLEFWSSLSK